MLAGKRILLGISGGIAAYQMVDFTGMLRSRLADVHIVMTKAATKFITTLTLKSVSRNPVHTEMFNESDNAAIEHIALAQMADIAVVAPATGNIIGKIANGIADDMLTTILMATKSPTIICPAMNENMWLNSIVQENVEKLKRHGYIFVEPEYGEMACGGEGWGRLARLDKILLQVMETAKEIDRAQTEKKTEPAPVN